MNTKTPKIEDLRKTGFKVRVLHQRNYVRRHPNKMDMSVTLSGKGGYTKIEITTPSNKIVVGEAHCNVLDNFNRKLGNKIALGRALKLLEKI
jgi:hypothetical protein